MKHYRIGFDHWGLALFLAVMVPNFVWFAWPAPNDILRGPSAVPVLDGVASVLQVGLAAALCLLRRSSRPAMPRGAVAGCLAMVLLYYAAWGMYYGGLAGAPVLLALCLAPCAAFALFAAGRRNGPALWAVGLFAVCHLAGTWVNYL